MRQKFLTHSSFSLQQPQASGSPGNPSTHGAHAGKATASSQGNAGLDKQMNKVSRERERERERERSMIFYSNAHIS